MKRKTKRGIFWIIGGFCFLMLISFIISSNFGTFCAKADVTRCLSGLYSIKKAEDTYISEFSHPTDLDELILEDLLSSSKTQSACATLTTSQLNIDGTYKFTARPKGDHISTCMLILTNTGMNTTPSLPAGCRR